MLYFCFRQNISSYNPLNFKSKDCRRLINFIILIILSYFLFLFINENTYVWQCTTFADIISPIKRNTCNIKIPLATHIKTNIFKKRKIGIVLLYGDYNNDKSWNDELMQRVIENRKLYSDRHGYDIINSNSLIDKRRPVAWSKLLAIEDALKTTHYDYVIYMDMDAVIMDLSKPIDYYIDISTKSDIIMTSDWNGPNTGVFIVKYSKWSLWFLRKAWEQDYMVQKKSPEGVSYPFEYEQRAIHFLMNSDIWKERGLAKYRGNSTEICQHIYILPQCAFNSYSIHPFSTKGDRQTSSYIDGDFVIHFAGKKGKNKVNLMTHYLQIAEEK